MDSSSHVCMGVATGLMLANVASNNNIEVNTASIVAISIIANVFPDIDIIFKLKGENAYINNHRGPSHSIFFAFIWILLISTFGYFSVNENYFIYLICATLGISLHIFTDLLNGYGVQFLWPFQKKWIAFGITYTFDAVLIFLHIISFILIFIFKTPILLTFFSVYSIIGLYILISFIYHYFLKKALIKKYGKYKRLILQAKATPFNWKYVYETYDKKFFMGVVRFKTIIQLRYEKRLEVLSPELEKILHNDNNVKAFIDFTPIYNYHIHKRENNIIEIKYYDLRYLMVRKGQLNYTFNCIVQVKDNVVQSSYLGFTLNEENAKKRFEKRKEKYSQ
ncbi:inner membrane protein [Bacilli bacterium PM5-3]|nr:inner membrane protein [Bacilli bacterium PM5-3]MDH6603030.1 inner membrane protein [Bacilli bacterium PM5-9]